METIYARVQLSGSGRSHIHGYKRTPPTFVDGSLTFASSTDSSITVGGVRAYSRESSFDILAAAFPAGDGTAATFADVQAAPSTASVLSVSGIANLSEANAASAHEFVLSGLLPDTQYDIVFFARDVLGLVTEVGANVLEGAGIKTAVDHTPPVSVPVVVNTVAKLAISEITGSTITIQTKGYDVGSTFQAHVAAFQVGTGAETMTLGEVKGHETYKASGLMNITSLSAAQASSPISVVVDMGLKELTAYEVVVFLEDAIGNVSSRLVSPHGDHSGRDASRGCCVCSRRGCDHRDVHLRVHKGLRRGKRLLRLRQGVCRGGVGRGFGYGREARGRRRRSRGCWRDQCVRNRCHHEPHRYRSHRPHGVHGVRYRGSYGRHRDTGAQYPEVPVHAIGHDSGAAY